MTEAAIDPGPNRARLVDPVRSPVVVEPSGRSDLTPHPAVRRTRVALLAAVALVVYFADVATKVAAVALLDEDDPVAVGETGLALRLVRNPGAAFGVGVNLTVLFTAVTALVVAVILRSSRRLGSRPWAITLGLLLGGALGNLTDRIARSPGPLSGHVIDFVEIPGWPIFNLADLSILTAGALMVVLACRNVPLGGGPRRQH